VLKTLEVGFYQYQYSGSDFVIRERNPMPSQVKTSQTFDSIKQLLDR